MNLRTVYRSWEEGIRAIVTQLLAFETANTSALDAKQPLYATLTAIADESIGAFSHRNKIINGGFAVNQRVYVSGAATTAGQYTLDRWKVAGTGGATFSTTANKTTVTIPSGQALQQVIEGLNLQSGTYVLSWEGTAQGKIGAGSLSASGVTGSITGGTNTTIEFGPGTVANVQLEPGSVATPFESRPHGTELALCERYYEKSFSLATAPAQNVGVNTGESTFPAIEAGAATQRPDRILFKTIKRAGPTVTLFNPSAANAEIRDHSAAADFTSSAAYSITENGFRVQGTSPAGTAANYTCGIHWTASAEL